MYVFICENSIEGIFSGIYRAYASRYGHSNIRLTTSDVPDTYDLFCEYEEVPVDYENSRKVAETLQKRLGQETFADICHAIDAYETPGEQQKNISKAEAVYKTVVLALSAKDGSRILEHLGNPYVSRVSSYAAAPITKPIIFLAFFGSVNWRMAFFFHGSIRKIRCSRFWLTTLPTACLWRTLLFMTR